ncbi:MAG: hypothetical protein MJ133_01245 [Lachnospiraceae bacterium]|nr:hypothetical protein [Lachnospiraceae bacterium]
MNYFYWIWAEARGIRRARYERKTQISSVKNIKKYAGKKVLNSKQANKMIYDAIVEKKPFFAGRLGGSEMKLIAYTYRNRYFPFRTDARADYLRHLCQLSGFFPNEMSMGEKFVELMTEAVSEIDLNGIWSLYMEEWYLHSYAPKSELTFLHNLEPWNVDTNNSEDVRWTYALKGKRVLVIHPFEESIINQFNKRKELFKNLDEKLLPDFELLTIKAVQSLGENDNGYNNWFEAYEYMLEQCKSMDFDVAIIGCGAYGFPLGAEIKKMGKCAIHLGGVAQLLFGIRGKRWDSYGGVYESMINDSWIRPSGEEITDIVKSVEDGCYC